MEKSSLGVSQDVAIVYSYVLGWLSGIVILLLEKGSGRVRFHAAQSLVVFGGLTLLSLLGSPLFYVWPGLARLINLATLILWLILLAASLQRKPIRIALTCGLSQKLGEKAWNIIKD